MTTSQRLKEDAEVRRNVAIFILDNLLTLGLPKECNAMVSKEIKSLIDGYEADMEHYDSTKN